MVLEVTTLAQTVNDGPESETLLEAKAKGVYKVRVAQYMPSVLQSAVATMRIAPGFHALTAHGATHIFEEHPSRGRLPSVEIPQDDLQETREDLGESYSICDLRSVVFEFPWIVRRANVNAFTRKRL